MEKNQNIENSLEKSKNEQGSNENETIFSTLEQIHDILLRDDCGVQAYFKDANEWADSWTLEPPLGIITSKLSLTTNQAMLLAHFVTNYPNAMSLKDLAPLFDCNRVHMLKYIPDINALLERGFIKSCENDSVCQYYVPEKIVNDFKTNNFKDETLKELSLKNFFGLCNEIIINGERGTCANHRCLMTLLPIIDANQTLPFVQKIKKYDLTDEDTYVLLKFCTRYIYCRETITSPYSYRIGSVSGGQWKYCINSKFHSNSKLVKNEFLKKIQTESRIACKYQLTDSAIQEFLSDEDIKNLNLEESEKPTNYVDYIEKKSMFYNPTENSQIAELSSLLSSKERGNIQNQSNGKEKIRITCLLDGIQGTGKTETVLQLAKQSGRDIIHIDFAKMVRNYIEQEKVHQFPHLKEYYMQKTADFFNNYFSQLKKDTVTPILFFNEIDTIISTQDTGKKELEEFKTGIKDVVFYYMKQFEGIFIATTNLTENLDETFLNKFSYNIHFQIPCVAVRKSIWQSMFPTLDESAIDVLATNYDFTGGQIENIARKRLIQNPLVGKEVTLDQLTAFCDDEKLNKCVDGN